MPLCADIVPALNPSLNRALIGNVYRRNGRVHVGSILTPDSANRIFQCLQSEVDYVLNVTTPDGVRWLHRDQNSPAQLAQVNRMAEEVARGGFAFQYDKYPMSDAGEPHPHPDHYLAAVTQFLQGEPFLQFCREVTGIKEIARADAQATCYRPGHFLTRHDDHVEGRLVAYVLNFTPVWNSDWGGMLLFTDSHGHVEEGYVPVWNGLNLMKVPQNHAVSLVAPFAGGLRYSITGWLLGR